MNELASHYDFPIDEAEIWIEILNGMYDGVEVYVGTYNKKNNSISIHRTLTVAKETDILEKAVNSAINALPPSAKLVSVATTKAIRYDTWFWKLLPNIKNTWSMENAVKPNPEKSSYTKCMKALGFITHAMFLNKYDNSSGFQVRIKFPNKFKFPFKYTKWILLNMRDHIDTLYYSPESKMIHLNLKSRNIVRNIHLLITEDGITTDFCTAFDLDDGFMGTRCSPELEEDYEEWKKNHTATVFNLRD